jgi:ribosomal protein S20
MVLSIFSSLLRAYAKSFVCRSRKAAVNMMTTKIKTFNTDTNLENQEQLKKDTSILISNLYSVIDKAAKKNVIHKNNAARKKSTIYKIFKRIKKSEGPIFVYSNFKDVGGLKSFIKFIEYHGYKNYKTFGEGEKTYSVWSGDETHQMKEEIKKVFNQKENTDGSKIKIMLGSPSIKEGVSLLRVEEIHILEPYWNQMPYY